MKKIFYSISFLTIIIIFFGCWEEDTLTNNSGISLKWRYRINGPALLNGYGDVVRLQPVIHSSFVYTESIGQIFKFSVDGSLTWNTVIRSDSLGLGERTLLYCELTNSLYFTRLRKIYSLDISTGNIHWSIDLPSESGWGLHAMSNTKVFIGCNDGVLYAVDKQSGTLSWSKVIRQTDERVMSVSYNNGFIYCSTLRLDSTNNEKGYLACVNDNTQEVEWLWNVPDEGTVSGGVITQVAFWNDRIIVSASNGHLYSIDSAGNIFWRIAVWASESTPVVKDNKIYITATDTYTSCVNPTNGNIIWKKQTPGSKSFPIALNSSQLATHSWDGKCYLFSQQTGDIIWSGYGLDYPGDKFDICVSPPALTDRELVFITQKYIYCFSIKN